MTLLDTIRPIPVQGLSTIDLPDTVKTVEVGIRVLTKETIITFILAGKTGFTTYYYILTLVSDYTDTVLLSTIQEVLKNPQLFISMGLLTETLDENAMKINQFRQERAQFLSKPDDTVLASGRLPVTQ